MINCTCGRDEPERAILSFVVGNTAATADQDAVVLLTIEGVWLATNGAVGSPLLNPSHANLADITGGPVAGRTCDGSAACAKPTRARAHSSST